MDFSASGGCQHRIHQVPRRSSVSSEHSSKLRFSSFFSFIPAGARLFCLGMLGLLLTLPCTYRVGAVTFAFNGFQESDVYMVPDSPWTFQSNTSCFYFDPPEASWNKSVPGRFLYPYRLQMKDPVTKQVKSFSTTFIYQIQIQEANSSNFPTGPGMSFIVVPDNFTVGAALDYMGLLTTDTSTSAKNYESDNHTLGVELDTFRNPEFNDPNDNHIGVNLASMLSTFIVDPVYPLYSVVTDFYTQIWIDYSEVDSRLDISIALYGEAKPVTPQGTQTGVDLSLLLENMFIGFSTAKGIESGNVPIVYAWSFSNDGIPAPPIVIGFDATSASPSADGPLGAPLEVSPSPSLVLISPIGNPPPISMANPRSLSTEAPSPTNTTKKRNKFMWGIIIGSTVGFVIFTFIVGIMCLLCRRTTFRHRMHIFISHRGASNGIAKIFTTVLHKRKIHANQRARKENGLMTYINKRLQLLFALSGLLNILLSVILDNFFNDLPTRFIAFGILAPLTIILGFLASGWFPRIPLRFIAFVKRRGFLQHVVPCSPWHDNVITNFCGEVCSLKPMEQEEGTRLLAFPMLVQKFLYSDQIFLQGTIAIAITHSTFDSETQDFQVATSVQEGQDLQGLSTSSEMFDFSPLSGILEPSHSKIAKRQASSPNLQDASSQGWDIVVDIDRSSAFHIFDNERAPILEFDGPEINGFHLTFQAFKNTLVKDRTFYLSCTFGNKRTKRMYLTSERLRNLIENMCRWVENPYPIVVDESSDILHCIAIEDILWKFTNAVYTFKPIHVEHRLLAGLGHIKFFIILSFIIVSFLLSLIPLLSDKRSLFFLFFLFILVPYMIALDDTNPLTFYFIKSLFSPICVKIFGFNRLYKSRSSFRWCNEFRKKKIVNPTYFWIDEEYANTCPNAARCLDVCEFVELPDSPSKDQSFTISCQGWPAGIPSRCKKQHDYKLRVKFDSIKLIEDVNCYTNVRLAFFENDCLLGTRNYGAVEVRRAHLVEKLFHCFSNPSFGGYVEKICPKGYCSTTFVAHCPRFIDFCQNIFCSNPIPKLLVASRIPGSKFTIGVPFWSLEL